MSLSSEITRLQNAKSALKTSIEAKGVTVSDTTLISGYAALVDEIQTGGGGGNEDLINLIERDITTLNIPSGTTKIGEYTFAYCKNITSVTIPDSVTFIGNNAFYYCRALTSISIPNGITSIEHNLFNNCLSLTTVNIPNSVTSIGSNAFGSCTALTSVTIPDSVTSIGDYAFSNCSALTSVIVPNYIPNISSYVFNGCTSLPVENYVQYASTWAIQNDRNQTSYTLRQDTTFLLGTFISCKGITSVGEIGSGASVEIPNSVVAIGQSCFQSCSGLTSVTIPDSVTSISNYAFYGCSKLTSVTIQATTPPTLGGSDAFGSTNNCPIYVPAESVDAYKTATNWKTYASRIQPIPTE